MPRPTKHTARGLIGAGAAMSLLGSLAGVSAAVRAYPLFGGQAIRYAIAAACLLTIARRQKTVAVRPTNRQWLQLTAIAASGLVAFNLCVVTATRYASPSLVSTVIAAVPVVLAIAGPLQQGRRPAATIVIAAVIVTVGAGLASGLGHGGLAGLLWSLGALAGEAAFSLLAVPLLPALGPTRVAGLTSALAVPLLLIVGAIHDGTAMLRMPTLGEALGYAYISLVITVVAFFLWYGALGTLGADQAGLFAGMVPISAVLTTLVLGQGVPGPGELAGSALVVLGVLLGLSSAGRREGRTLVRAAPESP